MNKSFDFYSKGLGVYYALENVQTIVYTYDETIDHLSEEWGVSPYGKFLDSLRDRQGAAKIKTRVTRAEMGNFGDHRSVGEGIEDFKTTL